jgi:hypothetical protein
MSEFPEHARFLKRLNVRAWLGLSIRGDFDDTQTSTIFATFREHGAEITCTSENSLHSFHVDGGPQHLVRSAAVAAVAAVTAITTTTAAGGTLPRGVLEPHVFCKVDTSVVPSSQLAKKHETVGG